MVMLPSLFPELNHRVLDASWNPCTSPHLFCICPRPHRHHLWAWITGKTPSCPSPAQAGNSVITLCLAWDSLALACPVVLLRSAPCWPFHLNLLHPLLFLQLPCMLCRLVLPIVSGHHHLFSLCVLLPFRVPFRLLSDSVLLLSLQVIPAKLTFNCFLS